MKKFLLATTAIGLVSFATPTLAADACILAGGAKGSTYTAKAELLRKSVDRNELTIHVKHGPGSWHNVKNGATWAPETEWHPQKNPNGKTCPIMFAQADAYALLAKRDKGQATKLEPIGGTHWEYVFFMCNRKLGDDTDFLESGDGKKIAVGKAGSGAWVTWNNLILEDDDYGKTTTFVTTRLNRAAPKVADGSDLHCMMHVTSMNSGAIQKISDRYGDSIQIVATNDNDFNDAKDPKGNDLYEFSKIDDNIYETGLTKGNFFDTQTIRMKALLLVNSDWADANESAFDALLDAFPAIRDKDD